MAQHIHLTEDKQFWLQSGKKLQTLHQLEEGLATMPAKTFSHHVTKEKNDFAAWVMELFEDAKLADAIKRAKTPKAMIKVIEKALEEADMKQITGIECLKQVANFIRQDLIKMLLEAGSGHSAGSLGAADIFAALYFNIMKHRPRQPLWEGRDRLFMSCGHIVPVRYAAMARAGYFPLSELMTLRKLGSRLQGHPERTRLPSVESTSGPLGSGLAQAAGCALALRLDKQRNRVFCFTSDGEHDAGNHWEAVLFAGKYRLSNLTAIMDRNNIQIDGYTEDVMPLEPLKEKYEAFNWHVIEVDGHNIQQIIDACGEARAIYEKPTMIICRTIPGKGIDFMEFDYGWHGRPPKPDEAAEALHQLRTLGGKIQCEHQ